MDADTTVQHDRETLQKAAEVRNALERVVDLARSAGQSEPDRQAAALFETTAEAASGLVKAVEHFQTGAEPAWRTSPDGATKTDAG